MIHAAKRAKTVAAIAGPWKTWFLAAFVAAHGPLAVLMDRSSAVANLHACVALGVGFWLALTNASPVRIACAAAYIAGSEVLWRMTPTSIFDQSAKYGVAFILGLAIVRRKGWKIDRKAAMYFALLLPSCLLTYFAADGLMLRKALSFNMSGPLALAVCISYFSNAWITRNDLSRIAYSLLGPTFGITVVAAVGVTAAAMTEKLKTISASSSVGSGGWGPNQVSAILGLSAFLAFFCIVGERGGLARKVVLVVLAAAFATQSALTFSRSGLYCAAGAGLAAAYYFLRIGQSRKRLFLFGGMLALGLALYVIPNLNELTGGALMRRFQDTSLTRRDDLARADLDIWLESPIFGVGPGVGRSYRRELVDTAADPHTEFTRLLAEHGLFGLTAMLVLASIGLDRVRRAKDDYARAMRLSFLVWASLFMATSAMRLSVGPLIFGMAAVTLYERVAQAPSRRRVYAFPPAVPRAFEPGRIW